MMNDTPRCPTSKIGNTIVPSKWLTEKSELIALLKGYISKLDKNSVKQSEEDNAIVQLGVFQWNLLLRWLVTTGQLPYSIGS